jgi:hypothetical protein
MTTTTMTTALAALRDCRTALLAARVDALAAATRLDGARRDRRRRALLDAGRRHPPLRAARVHRGR